MSAAGVYVWSCQADVLGLLVVWVIEVGVGPPDGAVRSTLKIVAMNVATEATMLETVLGTVDAPGHFYCFASLVWLVMDVNNFLCYICGR